MFSSKFKFGLGRRRVLDEVFVHMPKYLFLYSHLPTKCITISGMSVIVQELGDSKGRLAHGHCFLCFLLTLKALNSMLPLKITALEF